MKLFLGFLLMVLGQSLIWVQTNGQFVWDWFKKNPVIVSIVFGSSISYILIRATKLIVDYYDGLLWPSRFFQFAAGVITFAILTYVFKNEPLTLKTMVSIFLMVCLIIIQLFWK
jgi:hypothetical protein